MKCLNWKVIGGLAVVGGVLYLVAPDQFLGALPLLLLAACPLSMLFMMRGMQGGQCAQQGQPVSAAAGEAGQYTCPMHPDVRSDQPSRCPKCGMELVPATPRQAHAPQTVGLDASLTREEQLAQLRVQLQSLNEQQAALAWQLKELPAAEAPAPPSQALVEAAQVAQAAAGRRESKP